MLGWGEGVLYAELPRLTLSNPAIGGRSPQQFRGAFCLLCTTSTPQSANEMSTCDHTRYQTYGGLTNKGDSIAKLAAAHYAGKMLGWVGCK